MHNLNLPACELRICQKEDKTYIFDAFRKKYVALTPEEWVRQNFLAWLTHTKAYPKSLIAVETALKYNNLPKRADAVVYAKSGIPQMIIECKAPQVKIDQDVFDQAMRYNARFQVEYLVMTNGMEHYCCRLDYSKKTYSFIQEIPHYDQLNPINGKKS